MLVDTIHPALEGIAELESRVIDDCDAPWFKHAVSRNLNLTTTEWDRDWSDE